MTVFCVAVCTVALSNGRPVPAVLLANKSDQRRLGLCSKLPKMESFSKEQGFVGWYETSAKDNTNIDAAITCLVENILSVEDELASRATPKSDSPDSGIVVLPCFDNQVKEKGLHGCSGGCSGLRPRGRENI
ncbi:ras-related protein Rab-38 [Lampris incognitus]|uniref:ras-related protein Rab-38 n=1 Tax=Lampris incognitus TaxID=2546036 RepID=UPI0024B5E1A7|nr:ras-related protein Rab-38 [Lampris incognitus]